MREIFLYLRAVLCVAFLSPKISKTDEGVLVVVMTFVLELKIVPEMSSMEGEVFLPHAAILSVPILVRLLVGLYVGWVVIDILLSSWDLAIGGNFIKYIRSEFQGLFE